MVESHCRSGKQCAGRNSDGPAITAKPDTLCTGCITELDRKVAELPHLATALRTFLGGSMKVSYQSKVKASREPACPLNTRVDELLGFIEDALDRVDGLRIADLIQQPAMRFVLWVGDRRREVFLDGCDRALEVRRVHARANKVLGFDKILHRRAAPCPACSLPTLANYVGEGTVFCTEETCGYATDLDAYDELCAELTKDV